MATNSVDDIANKIYARCCEKFSSSQLLYQRDILGLGFIPDKNLETLLECTQKLVDQNLFRVYQDSDGRLGWKVIAEEDALKIQGLNESERMVYNVIHSTGRNGIWIRQLGKRTDLHKTSLDKALKTLEGKNFIKSIHNVKHPGKKVYMLAELTPAEDVTGGAWFTDGVLDVQFIGTLSDFIEIMVSGKSWYEVVDGPANNKTSNTGGGSSNKRQKLNSGETSIVGKHAETTEKQYYPYPASYQYYPTVEEITVAVNKSGITPVKLDEGSTRQLVQMMCFDGRLVSLNDEQNFKSTRRPDAVPKLMGPDRKSDTQEKTSLIGKNGMTEAPCGQCPVFKLCQPGGVVSPENCEYFDPWFKTALGF